MHLKIKFKNKLHAIEVEIKLAQHPVSLTYFLARTFCARICSKFILF